MTGEGGIRRHAYREFFSPRDRASYGPMSVRLSFTSCGSIKNDVYGSTWFLVCRLPSS